MVPAFMSFKNVNFIINAVLVIRAHEGFRRKKYKDSKGIWTIGYGFNLESGTFSKEQVERWKKDGITQEEADIILAEHIQKIMQKVDGMPWVMKLNFPRRLAIIDMCFNMGMGWLDRWTNTVGFIKAGNYKAAANAIRKSLYAKQVGARALRNALAIELGQYPEPTLSAKQLMLMTGATN